MGKDMMRFIAVLVTSGLVVACGGISGGLDDGGGNGDASDESQSNMCNGTSCSAYCIHPSTTTCPTCTSAPDSGTCPAGSTLQKYCPSGPPMQGDAFCVSYPPPDPPFCSDTIPGYCFPQNTPTKPGDVDCMESGCAL
jgi:hypothetical protein